VTHPFHPLRGRELDLVVYRNNWSEDHAYFHDEEGRLRAIPAAWTSLVGSDPVVVLGSGRSPFRLGDLLELVRLLEGLRQ
jgi:hypothetical protein